MNKFMVLLVLITVVPSVHASPIYGSDAMAGVTNISAKQKVESRLSQPLPSSDRKGASEIKKVGVQPYLEKKIK